jgi:shikimate dehydrogenase
MIRATTQLVAIVGTPIAQVKSPDNFNAWFASAGVDVAMIAMDVRASQVPDLIALMRGWQNLRGCVVTVPHKQAFAAGVDSTTARAAALGAVNVVRRDNDGSLAGDTADGFGFITASAAHGFAPAGCRALVIGAGGVGSAIAYALAEAGIGRLVLEDVDDERVEALTATLARTFAAVRLGRGAGDLAGFDLVVNATPIGMDARSLPLDAAVLETLSPHALVADVVTSPAVTPLLELARRRGCRVQAGPEMARSQMAYLGAFLRVMPPIEGVP